LDRARTTLEPALKRAIARKGNKRVDDKLGKNIMKNNPVKQNDNKKRGGVVNRETRTLKICKTVQKLKGNTELQEKKGRERLRE